MSDDEEPSASEGQVDAAVLNEEINKEALKIFKHLAIDEITRNLPEYDISDTYKLENPDLEMLDLLPDLMVEGTMPTVLQPIICPETGNILRYEEKWNVAAETRADAVHSMSMNRAPDPEAFKSVVGKRGNIPFLPGGFESDIDKALQVAESICDEEELKCLDFSELLTITPGFSQSIVLPDKIDPIKPTAATGAPPPGMGYSDNNLGEFLKSGNPSDIHSKIALRNVAVDIGNIVLQDEKDNDEPEDDAEANEDLTAATKESDADFTHAQFLDDAKVIQKYDSIRPIMARAYPFELDTFQKHAVVSMENGDSVFVAAHTSAGKTVVAEYAIALCKIHKTRVIYTSPIKALSNQKFREFHLAFGDVGLITGDIQLNTDAFCLVMTTEVLRSMLYNGSEVIRELEWVIFDEVHYINDEERGHVWEEVLIMLPSHVSIVMLSATVPNCVEFADWVGRIKQRKITVVQTLKRPVPLEHFIYTGHDGKSREELFLIMDKLSQLSSAGYLKATQAKAKINRPPDTTAIQQQQNQQQGRNRQQPKNSKAAKHQNQQMMSAANAAAGIKRPMSNYQLDRNIYSNLTHFLKARNFLPCVVFVFSRKRCDDNAHMMKSADLTTQSEKSEIAVFFNKCLGRLKGTDKTLPQIESMRSLCERGFAVHHSGILPILKEVVELLFQRGLVKILFATETFAMGVNMPARCVVFDAIEKFDGNQKRPLNPTEYTQMAGRAGRRGLDETGIVIVLAKKEIPQMSIYSQLMTGKAVRLESRFRVTYAMLLKLLRVEQFRIEDMLQRSYVERSSLRLVVTRKKRITELNEEILAVPPTDCNKCLTTMDGSGLPSIEEYFTDVKAYFNFSQSIWVELMADNSLQKMLLKGRLLLINYPPLKLFNRMAVMLDVKRDEHNRQRLTLMVLASESDREFENAELKAYSALTDDERRANAELLFLRNAASRGVFCVNCRPERSYRIIYDFDMCNLVAICKQSLKNVDVESILKEDSRRGGSFRPRSPDRCITSLIVQLESLGERWTIAGAPIAMFGSDIKAKNVDLYDRVQRVAELQIKLAGTYPCQQCPIFENHFMDIIRRSELQDKLQMLTFQTSAQGLLLSGEYENRIRFLRALDYIDKDNLIGLKGKVACEVSHMEVLITELMLENKFEGKSCAELAAMLSPLTCQFTYGGSRDRDMAIVFGHPINDELRGEILHAANKIDNVQIACGVHSSFIIEELRFGLMDVVYEWASGTPFAEIMKLTECQEGLIVRCIQRLDEVCKDVRNAARIIGDPVLYEKLEETSTMIKRDIVFAASLYTTDEA